MTDRALRRKHIRRLLGYARKYRGMIALALLCMVVYSVAHQGPVLLSKFFLDGVLLPDETAQDRDVRIRQVVEIRRYLGGEIKRFERGLPVRLEERAWLLDWVARDPAPDKPLARVEDEVARHRQTLVSLVSSLANDGSTDWTAVRATYEREKDASVISATERSRRTERLIKITAAILILAILSGLTGFFNEVFAKLLATRVVADLRMEIMRHMVNLSLNFFSRKKLGDIYSRLTNDVTTTFKSINVFVSELLLQPFMVLAGVAVAFVACWQLAGFTILFIPLLVWPVVRLGRRVQTRSRRGLEVMGETTEAMTQVLSGIRVVKAFRMEEREMEEFARISERFVRKNAGIIRAKALGKSVMDVIYAVSLGLFLLGGGLLILQTRWNITPGGMIAFVGAVAAIYRPLTRLASAYHNFLESMAGAARLFELLDARPAVTERPDAIPAGPLRRSVAFENVSYRYEGESAEVLQNISFTIRAGETVALVGHSGSGKSTVADLLLRFDDPTEGRILVDGVDLRDLERSSIVGQVAVVGQQPFIFNTTVRENIGYGRPDAEIADIEAAARAAGIHDVIAALPHGYDTVVGERGERLSGGELQRITIARAILKNASFLILDEATSSLDARSELIVQSALVNLMRGRTSLIIAHRLSTVMNADRILVLDRGRIVEEGTHAELMRRRGAYFHLYEIQTSGAIPILGPEALATGAGA